MTNHFQQFFRRPGEARRVRTRRTAETTTATAYDELTVSLVSSSGTVLKTLGSFSNLNKGTGYTQRTADASAYRGQTVTVRCSGTEDSSLQTSFVVDDTALTVG